MVELRGAGILGPGPSCGAVRQRRRPEPRPGGRSALVADSICFISPRQRSEESRRGWGDTQAGDAQV